MAFRKKWHLLTDLKPDLLIIQECEQESKYKEHELIPNYNQFIWIGDNSNKGVGIISFNNYHFKLSDRYSIDYKYIIPVDVTGDAVFHLFAIWAMPSKLKRKESYVGQIWKAVNFYKEILLAPSVLIGDWNSNAIWNHERKIGNHAHVVDLLKEHDIKSVYHESRNEEHGTETEPTLFLLKNKEKPYHLDYCFVTGELIDDQTSVEVGKYEKWIKHSDHMPLIIDHLIC